MKAVIFAGGVGTRLWPLSRKKSPKQFEKVIGDKSTLQLAVERLLPDFAWNDIYIATGERYKNLIANQLPQIPEENIIGEPEMKDVGPAVGLATALLMKEHPDTPVLLLWSDHIVKNEHIFKDVLIAAGDIIKKNLSKLVFITQKPRFASQNLGWINYGKSHEKINAMSVYQYLGLIYRPSLEEAEKFLKSGHMAWNIGYFVTTPRFLWQQFQKYQPQLYQGLDRIHKFYKTPEYHKVLNKTYSQFKNISFDDAILKQIETKDALVISEDLQWSDVGAWEALKEALQVSPEQNVVQGKVLLNSCSDTLVYNYTDQLVVAIDLDGLLVVNTNDVIMICHKNSVPKIKKLVESLSGSENEHLT